jgi:hypothetical protein
MSTARPLVRRPAQRPHPSPNGKGLEDGVRVVTIFPHADEEFLRERARYETQRWRFAHDGKGREISAQDILRRLVADFRRKEPAIPADVVGRAIRGKAEA